ncbi:PilN domain-containing protein [Indiicoccus explosivorum]|uniref:PilN domain-containing protein n=1 Tax=Indiicoccus explosivorum TaxID=1917864 RepID=UPI000B4539FA|nr:fimbrial assembly protein [Indiicoccus explosivorum]
MLVDINLLPQKERDRPAVVIAAASILLAALLIWITLFFMTNGEENRQQALQAESAETAALQAELRDLIAARSGLNEEQQLAATVMWAQDYQYDTVPLLAELASLLPERGFFVSYSFAGPNTATLEVQFDNTREAAFYLTHLKNSELLSDASLLSVQGEEVGEEEEGMDEDATLVLPRYVASYELTFTDDRIPAEGAAETPVAQPVETPAGETPPADAPAEEAPEEEPADVTETAEGAVTAND